MNILKDIKTAVNVFGAVRKARKDGASGVQVKPVYSVPVINPDPAWCNTMEGCLTHKLGQDADLAVMRVFKGLPYETQRRLEFTPENPGEWVERAQFWRQQLKPVLPEQTYHNVMILFISWYARCLRRRRAREVMA